MIEMKARHLAVMARPFGRLAINLQTECGTYWLIEITKEQLKGLVLDGMKSLFQATTADVQPVCDHPGPEQARAPSTGQVIAPCPPALRGSPEPSSSNPNTALPQARPEPAPAIPMSAPASGAGSPSSDAEGA